MELKKYLKPTDIIDCDSPSVRDRSRELTEGEKEAAGKAISLFYFVRDAIRYNLYVSRSRPEHFQASRTLANGHGYCVQKAVLLTALARAVDIPAALGFARLRNHLLPEKTRAWLGTDILPFHGYTELYIDGRWVKATPAFDAEMCRKYGIIPVDFDGKNDGMFHSHNRDGKLHIEYLEDLGHHYDDLPLEKLQRALIETIGPGALEPPLR